MANAGPNVAGSLPLVPVTVVLNMQNGDYSSKSLEAMQSEAQRILGKAGVRLDWRLKSNLQANAEFANVVVFSMTGKCAMDDVPQLIDERGPLALTYGSNGSVLSFGEVRCDRVKASVERSTEYPLIRRADSLLGIALGRVIAHEMYHMLSEEGAHTHDGVARASLRADDLIRGTINFDPAALARINSRLRKPAGSR